MPGPFTKETLMKQAKDGRGVTHAVYPEPVLGGRHVMACRVNEYNAPGHRGQPRGTTLAGSRVCDNLNVDCMACIAFEVSR